MRESQNVRDYAASGITIREAMLDHGRRFPDKFTRPKYLLWSGLHIWTSDSIPVPQEGIVRADFMHADSDIRQGIDLKLHDGWIELAGGECVPHLRVWRHEEFEDTVEYPFYSRDELLWVWNVYEMTYPSGERVIEKWTENAGFWVQTIGVGERIYHCSHGMANPPDFNSLVFKITIHPR